MEETIEKELLLELKPLLVQLGDEHRAQFLDDQPRNTVGLAVDDPHGIDNLSHVDDILTGIQATNRAEDNFGQRFLPGFGPLRTHLPDALYVDEDGQESSRAHDPRRLLRVQKRIENELVTHPDLGKTVIGFDDLGFASFLNPPLTTVRAPTETVGQIATKRLFELLEGHMSEGVTVLPTEIIYRRSCGCEPET